MIQRVAPYIIGILGFLMMSSLALTLSGKLESKYFILAGSVWLLSLVVVFIIFGRKTAGT